MAGPLHQSPHASSIIETGKILRRAQMVILMFVLRHVDVTSMPSLLSI